VGLKGPEMGLHISASSCMVVRKNVSTATATTEVCSARSRESNEVCHLGLCPWAGCLTLYTLSVAFLIALTIAFILPFLARPSATSSFKIEDNDSALDDARSPSPPDGCSQPIRDNCSFYTHCLEHAYQCGPTGYPLAYGHKFCAKFRSERARLSPVGQEWMLDTMHCLQIALVPELTMARMSCKRLEKRAMESHGRCYVDNGFCELGFEQRREIMGIIGLGTLFSSMDAMKSSLSTSFSCFLRRLSRSMYE
jgi:hypothetical protein